MIPPAPPKNPRQARHSPKTIKLARLMYANGEAWTPSQIVGYIREQGITPVPHVTTVRTWVVPGVWESRADMRARTRPRARPKVAPSPGSITTVEERLRRLRSLRAAGMSFGALAILARVDFGLDIDDERVRYLLQSARRPQTLVKHLGGEA